MERYFWERRSAGIVVYDRKLGVVRPDQEIATAKDSDTADALVAALNATVRK